MDLTWNAGGILINKLRPKCSQPLKKLALKEENAMVARVPLHSMHQDHDEIVHSFSAHLHSQAGECNFLIKCPLCYVDVNYIEAILHDVLTCGIADTEIQLDLLEDKNQEMTLEEISQFLVAKEAKKCSATRLLVCQGAEAPHGSTYRRNKRDTLIPGTDHDKMVSEICGYCGKKVMAEVLPLPSGGSHAPPKTTPVSTVADRTTLIVYVGVRTEPGSLQRTSSHPVNVKEPCLMPLHSPTHVPCLILHA